MIGLFVREAADVADGRRQQTHDSSLQTLSSSFTERFAVTSRSRSAPESRKSRLVRARTWLVERWPKPVSEPIVTKYRLARYTERASTNAPVGRASGQLENASPPITFTECGKRTVAISFENHLPSLLPVVAFRSSIRFRRSEEESRFLAVTLWTRRPYDLHSDRRRSVSRSHPVAVDRRRDL